MTDFIQKNKDLVSSKPDARKSLKTKQQWATNAASMLKGIQKYHRSLEGRKAHRKLGQHLATHDALPKLDQQNYLVGLRKELRDRTSTMKIGEKLDLRDQFEFAGPINWNCVNEEAANEDLGINPKTIVDGKNILARISGPFFLVNGVSKNGRFYSRRLWENALHKMKKVLENGGSIGTVGHDQELNDKALLEGKISHVVTKLWIDDTDPAHPVGMGEAIILGTPPGHVLNSLFRAGVRIPVSSRAFGTYRGKGSSGEDIIDEDSFEPITWDFILSPGVTTAYPGIVEDLRDAAARQELTENKTMEATGMDVTVQKLTQERLGLQADLDQVLKQNESLQKKIEELSKGVAQRNRVLESYKKLVGSVEQASKLDEHLRKFLELEPLKSFSKEMGLFDLLGGDSGVSKLIGVTEAYRKLGSPKELAQTKSLCESYSKKGSVEDVSKLVAVTESYMKYGTPKQVAQLKAVTESYMKYGTPKQVAATSAAISEYQKIGKIEDIRKVFKIAEAYFQMGSPKKIAKQLEAFQKQQAKKKDDQKSAVANKIAEAFQQPLKGVQEMLKFMPAEKVIEVLKERHETASVEKQYKVTESKPTVRGKLPSLSAGPGSLTMKMFEDMR